MFGEMIVHGLAGLSSAARRVDEHRRMARMADLARYMVEYEEINVNDGVL